MIVVDGKSFFESSKNSVLLINENFKKLFLIFLNLKFRFAPLSLIS